MLVVDYLVSLNGSGKLVDFFLQGPKLWVRIHQLEQAGQLLHQSEDKRRNKVQVDVGLLQLGADQAQHKHIDLFQLG